MDQVNTEHGNVGSLDKPLVSSNVAAKKLSESEIEIIRATILSFLQRCGLSYLKETMPEDFYDACVAEAKRLNLCMQGPESIEPYMDVGAMTGCFSYKHVEDRNLKIHISVLTTALVYLDDNFRKHIDSLSQFIDRFNRGEEQADLPTMSLDIILRQTMKLYGTIGRNMLVSSVFNFVISLLLEYENQNMQYSKHAIDYPAFIRRMSGVPEGYSVLVFPPDCPTEHYIQAFPDMITYVDNANDVMSFYKEELVGDAGTQSYMVAACRGLTKLQALEYLTNECVEAHKRVLRILEPHKDAYNAWLGYAQGYITFHVALKRYRLAELFP